ncbi:MAG: hypothetical protein MZV70_75925 [Desulfobacterales bacterium]|nr:hypothetical protein [Desulfobacterales bacterium]
MHDPGRRLSGLLAYGDEAAHPGRTVRRPVARISSGIWHTQEARHPAGQRLRLPPEPTFTVRRLVDEVRLAFPTEPAGNRCARHWQRTNSPPLDRKRFVRLLDWGIRGTADTPGSALRPSKPG